MKYRIRFKMKNGVKGYMDFRTETEAMFMHWKTVDSPAIAKYEFFDVYQIN